MKYIYCFLLLSFLTKLNAQHETLESRVHTKPENQLTSEPYSMFTSKFTMVQVNVNKDGKNIIGDAANEPSLAIDPKNPNRMMIGWRQFDDIQNNFRQAGFAYTEDAGKTWKFPGVIQPGIFRSDPVLDTDTDGKFYYNSLTIDTAGEYSCDVFRTNDLKTWDNGVSAHGGDKQWMIVDKVSYEGKNNIYSFWSAFYSSCNPYNFTYSNNKGNSYTQCTATSNSAYWGNMAIGTKGEVLIPGPEKLFISSNAKLSPTLPIWTIIDYEIGGNPLSFDPDSPNPSGLLGVPQIAVNHASGMLNGQIYLLGSVVSDPFSEKTQITFIRSLDNGKNWSFPIIINDEVQNKDNWHWFGTMSVAPNGRIDVAWLDTRDYPESYSSSLYYSYSVDGGVTWSKNERLTNPFDPHKGWPQQNKMGDYFQSISDNEGMNLAWAATFGDEQNVYFSKIIPDLTSASQTLENKALLYQNSPNPASEKTSFQYYLPNIADSELKIYNSQGVEIKTITTKNAIGNMSHEWEFDSSLSSGLYFYELFVNEQFIDRKKLIIVR